MPQCLRVIHSKRGLQARVESALSSGHGAARLDRGTVPPMIRGVKAWTQGLQSPAGGTSWAKDRL